MYLKLLINLIFVPYCHLFVFSNGETLKDSDTNEIISQGRVQYQLLRERGKLPKYGDCWKSALETVDEGCRELSEETQSDIALALTNCFLEMSGIETHHCEMDKKLNVRQICISSMSDRAFNVYTEFYTHTLNMCWFLRGQIWQETISENTLRVGKQLEFSAAKQEKLLEIQKESLELQDKMLKHGKIIENVLADLSLATETHQEMLLIMGQAISSLQSWLIGEVSWVNTLIFYISFGVFIIILTSTPRTITARLPILLILIINIAAERITCALILNNNDFRKNTKEIYGDVQDCIQLLRYFFVILSFIVIIYKAYFYEDAMMRSSYILDSIHKQNAVILEKLDLPKNNLSIPDRAYFIYKKDYTRPLDYKEQIEGGKSNVDKFQSKEETLIDCIPSVKTPINSVKYNLRSRQNTPNS